VKTRTFGVAVVALMTISTLAGVAGAMYQAAVGQGAGPTPQAAASQPVSAAGTSGQPGDNAAVSAFKLVCPFH